MPNFHIIGSGCCGFLRIFNVLSKHIPIKYKGGGPKYQNSFERWNLNNGLIWDAHTLNKDEKLRRVSLHDDVTNITHSYIQYIPEFIELNPNIKFLCLRGEKEHSIKSLATSWGYRNPCYVSNREIGFGKNRYAVSQFPNLSDSKDEFDATRKYWEMYYELAEVMQEAYPDNFLIVDAPKFFSEGSYQKEVLDFFDLNIDEFYLPVDFDDCTITTSLHGGIGNNLFQMGEVISFCEKYSLPKPVFGTWDLWQGGGKYPLAYNSDRFIGGHYGEQDDVKNTFPNLNWKENLSATYDTKFMVNDMFRFCDVECKDFVRETLSVSNKIKSKTASLHLRFCTLPADDHVIHVDDKFYFEVFEKLPKGTLIYVFADNNQLAKEKIEWFEQQFDFEFVLFEGDAFQTLKEMVECEYHILHSSTYSVWVAFLDKNQPNNKVFYSRDFIDTHGKDIVPYKEWICCG